MWVPPVGYGSRTATSPLASAPLRIYLLGRMLGGLARRLVGGSLGWYVCERTSTTSALASFGLVQVVPVITLALQTGATAGASPR